MPLENIMLFCLNRNNLELMLCQLEIVEISNERIQMPYFGLQLHILNGIYS